MPYIRQKRREELKPVIDTLIDHEVNIKGDLNYILFKYCKLSVEPSYNNYKEYIAELNECASEIRRRFLAPYEDKKIIENGDI